MSDLQMSPCPELVALLRPAYMPCTQFAGQCHGVARWSPATGHVPRGFVGALGTLAEIELVLLVAEPGDPLTDEVHDAAGDVDDIIARVTRYVYEQYARGRTQFHRNIRFILDSCWPGMGLHAQLQRTWITETFLCSAPVECGTVRVQAEKACARAYLVPQLRLLGNRVVVALGNKAWDRTKWLRMPFPIRRASAAAPPGCNRREARPSWEAIPGYLAQR